MILYDCEIINSPDDIGGWGDFGGMGISVICWYDYNKDVFGCWQEGMQMSGVQAIMDEAKVIAGYNIIKFDNNLLRAHGVNVDDNKCYDILRQIWYANGLGDYYDHKTHGGFSLNTVVKANFPSVQKSMSGADAPKEWQNGNKSKVIEYCMNDVKITKMLMDRILIEGGVINPKTKKFIRIAQPSSI